ncbi:hypothetical protein JTT01_00275 [Clostridium botulinum]|nr:hypothetical protein [Clostridium botulinum]
MDEQQFLKTMIETVKYDDEYSNKDELLGILRNSKITYDKLVIFHVNIITVGSILT